MIYFKYLLIAMGFLGLFASIYNMVSTDSFTEHTAGFLSSFFLFVFGIYFGRIWEFIKKHDNK